MKKSGSPQVSLEQWASLRALIEEGSYARAAERLNKSQSSVSYTIAQMGHALPVDIFTIQGRKAVLTDEGRRLYQRACRLLDAAEALEEEAQVLADGWETEITLAIDVVAPMEPLLRTLQAFSQELPHIRLRLLETTLSATDEALLERQADIVVCVWVPPGFWGESMGQVEMIPVVSPEHRLWALAQQGPLDNALLAQERQIVIRDMGRKREQNAGWLGSDQRWTLTFIDSSIRAVKAGLGFAFLPKERIASELERGELKQLPLMVDHRRVQPLHAVLTNQDSAGAGAQRLMTLLLKEYKTH